MMTTLYLVRHGEALGNKLQRFHGHTDSDITENGEAQLRLLAKRFAEMPIDVIVSSDLRRTKATAKAINTHHSVEIELDSQLREINGGQWEDMAWSDVEIAYPKQSGHWNSSPHLAELPGGESMRGFEARVIPAIKRIIEKHRGKRVAVSTHGTVIRVLQCWCMGLDLSEVNRVAWCENTSITQVEFDEAMKPKILRLSDDAHLPEVNHTMRKQAFWVAYQEQYGEENV